MQKQPRNIEEMHGQRQVEIGVGGIAARGFKEVKSLRDALFGQRIPHAPFGEFLKPLPLLARHPNVCGFINRKAVIRQREDQGAQRQNDETPDDEPT